MSTASDDHGSGRAVTGLPDPTWAVGSALWRCVLMALVLTAAGDLGAVLVVGRHATAVDGRQAASADPRTEVAGPLSESTAAPPPAPAGAGLPTSLTIPTLGLQTVLQHIVLESDGVLAAPADTSTAGWWSQGTAPGQAGPAVLVGHVDSRTGPAVFSRIHELKTGDPVRVTRDDGKVVTFVVDQVEEYKKADLPTLVVYGPTPAPALRLITCGGHFDRQEGSYESNVVVFAHEGQPPARGRAR